MVIILKSEVEHYEEEFVLPNKWYIKATRENEQILRKFRGCNHNGWEDNLVMLSDPCWGNTQYIRGYTEITFEQFKKYVLKKEDEPKSFPDKWAIKQSTSELVCTWFNQNSSIKGAFRSGAYKYLVYPEQNSRLENYSDIIPEGYQEITEQQFIDHILNKPVNQLNNQSNGNTKSTNEESKGHSTSDRRTESTGRFDIQIGGCGNGLETGNRKRQTRSCTIGKRTRDTGEGLCVGRITRRSITI